MINFHCDIALVVETWFTKKHSSDNLSIDGFNLFRFDRPGKRKGGGLCAYVRNSINCTPLNLHAFIGTTDVNIEMLWLACSTEWAKFVICICYVPPKPIFAMQSFMIHLANGIDYIVDNVESDFIAIAGDFNSLDTAFIEADHGFIQLVNEPTHENNLIDKFFISRPSLYVSSVCKSVVKTRHKAVLIQSCCSAPTNTKINNNARKKCVVYDKRPHIIDFLRHCFGTFDWSYLYDIQDIDVLYSEFITIVKKMIDYCIPKKIVKMRVSEPYYITPHVKLLLNQRNHLRRQGKIRESNELASKINAKIAKRQSHRLSKLSTAQPKEIWKAVRSCNGQKNVNNNSSALLSDPDAVNRFFANISTDPQYKEFDITRIVSSMRDKPTCPPEYEIEVLLRNLKNTSPGYDEIPCWLFKSCSFELAGIISHIFERTFQSGVIPNNWKTAVVTPIPKTNKPTSLSEFRPISVTPILSRLAEKILVRSWLRPAMGDSILCDQYAYRDTGSTTCALIRFLDSATSSLEKNNYVKCVLVDFSKAFDIVDHNIVITKINSLNMPESIKKWIVSFLTNRKQKVIVDGVCSQSVPINRGIVQGSVLGPFLFCVMISDLKSVSISNALVKYADDLAYLIAEGSDCTANTEMDNSKEWASDNKLIMNLAKTKEIILSRQKPNGKTPCGSFDDIELVHDFKLLGINLDERLNFNNHVHSLLSSCNQRLYLLKIIRDQGAPLNVLHSIYEAIIVNKITYGISAWGGFISDADVDRINSIFRKSKRYGYTNVVYDFKGLLDYYDSALFKKIQHSHHCLHHILPPTIPDNKPSRNRAHPFYLPKCKYNLYRKSFLPRCLYNYVT